MTTRKTEHEMTVRTFEEFEGAVDLAAAKQSEIKRLQQELNAAKSKVEAAKKLLGCYLTPSEEYALANEDEIFPDPANKERETANSVYGLKQNANPSVVLADGLIDEDVIEKIKRSKTLDARFKSRFVQCTPKLARQDIIAAYKANEVNNATLKRLGLTVKKVKSLYVQAKAA